MQRGKSKVAGLGQSRNLRRTAREEKHLRAPDPSSNADMSANENEASKPLASPLQCAASTVDSDSTESAPRGPLKRKREQPPVRVSGCQHVFKKWIWI